MSVVLLIIALLTAMSVKFGLNMLDNARKAQTRQKLDRLEQELMNYRIANNRLPCPADPAALTTDSSYGKEKGAAGDCSGGSVRIDSTNNVAEGAIPFQQLGLSQEFMYDGWGRKIAYAVNYNVTGPQAMTGQALSDQCKITIKDADTADSNRSTGAVYALVSFGPDGHGGYLKSGTRLSAAVSGGDELTNCHCDSSATPTAYSATYVMKERSESTSTPFGDLVRFKERWQMSTPDDFYSGGGPVCSTGFRIDGTIADGYVGQYMWFADINHDGIPDLLIMGLNAAGTSYNLYVVFGKTTGFSGVLTLDSLNGSNGFTLTNIGNSYTPTIYTGDVTGDGRTSIVISFSYGVTSDYLILGGSSSDSWPSTPTDITTLNNGTTPRVTTLQSTATAYSSNQNNVAIGDINGDGINDIVVGDTDNGNAYGGKGKVAVYFGRSSWPSSLAWTDLTGGTASGGGNGFTITGGSGAHIALSTAIGNIQHHAGTPHPSDILIGAVTSALIWGQSSSYSWPADIDLTALPSNGSQGLLLTCSSACNTTGIFVAAGDLSGDGIDDAVISQYEAGYPTYVGNVYVINGNDASSWTTNTMEISSFSSGVGTVYHFPSTSTYKGAWSMLLTDLTGDSKTDLVVQGWDFSSVYNYKVIFNNAAAGAASYTIDSLTGNNGYAFDITASSYAYGPFLAGDLDGDGINDLVIGNAESGKTYVIVGKSSGYDAVFDTSNTYKGTDWVRIDGAASGDHAGQGIAIGDLNGDGTKDLAIGAPHANNQASNAGSIYVLWGGTKWRNKFSSGTFSLTN